MMRLTESLAFIIVSLCLGAWVFADKANDFQVPAVKYKVKHRQASPKPEPIPSMSEYGFDESFDPAVDQIPGVTFSPSPEPLPSVSSSGIPAPMASPSVTPSPSPSAKTLLEKTGKKGQDSKESKAPVLLDEDLDEDESMDATGVSSEVKPIRPPSRKKVGLHPETGGFSVTSYKSSWQFLDGLDKPESAYYDPFHRHVYVSNVSGQPDARDNTGWISKLTPSGRVVAKQWVKGLHAPKGMRATADTLWVTDVNRIVAIDKSSGNIKLTYTVLGSLFLNDLVIDERSDKIYISDTPNNAIWIYEKGRARIFLKAHSLDGPNGLLLDRGNLIIAAWGPSKNPDGGWETLEGGQIYELNLKTKRRRDITRAPLGKLDGLEKDDSGNYLVSDWEKGMVYRVMARSGRVQTLLRGFKNSADIGVIPGANRTVLIPSMGADRVDAYDLNALDRAIRDKAAYGD